jgi:hypothetical protein
MFGLLTFGLLAQQSAHAQLRCTVHVVRNPPPDLSDWTTRKVTLTAVITNLGSKNVSVRFDAKISKDGALQANTKPESMPTFSVPPGTTLYNAEDIIPFYAVSFHGNADRVAGRTGKLPAGDYTICVGLLDPITLKELTVPDCKNFSLTSYEAPHLLQPDDKAVLPKSSRPMFRWTAVSPKYPGVVQYEVQVFEILKGQSAVTAFRANRPILDKGPLTMTQLLWPPDYELPQPGRQYVWGVIASDDHGNRIGEPNGFGGPNMFTYCCFDPRGNGDSTSGRLLNPVTGGDSAGVIGSGHLPSGGNTLNPGAGADSAKVNRTGRLPAGDDYTLIQPADGATLELGNPIDFMWRSAKVDSCEPKPCDDPATIEIALVDGDKLTPFFRQSGIRSKIFHLPRPADPAPAFKVGKQYVWTIQPDGGDTAKFRGTGPNDLNLFTISNSGAVPRGPSYSLFVTSSRDCSSAGQGCVDIFPTQQPSDHWLAELKKDSRTTQANTSTGTLKLFNLHINGDGRKVHIRGDSVPKSGIAPGDGGFDSKVHIRGDSVPVGMTHAHYDSIHHHQQGIQQQQVQDGGIAPGEGGFDSKVHIRGDSVPKSGIAPGDGGFDSKVHIRGDSVPRDVWGRPINPGTSAVAPGNGEGDATSADKGTDHDYCPRCPWAGTLVFEPADTAPGLKADGKVVLANDYHLSKAICDKLGIEDLTIRKGEYLLDPSIGSAGGIYFDVTTDSEAAILAPHATRLCAVEGREYDQDKGDCNVLGCCGSGGITHPIDSTDLRDHYVGTFMKITDDSIMITVLRDSKNISDANYKKLFGTGAYIFKGDYNLESDLITALELNGSFRIGRGSYPITVTDKLVTIAFPNANRITLVSPSISSPEKSLRPTFTWKIAADSKHIVYHFRLMKLEPDQDENPGVAFRANRPILDKGPLTAAFVKYPDNLPPLEAGQVYVWTVDAYREGTPPPTSQNPTSFAMLVAGSTTPSQMMPCRDCYFCDGRCVRIGIATCYCLPILKPLPTQMKVGNAGTPDVSQSASVMESRAHTISRAPNVIWFGSTSRDCRSRGNGCAEIFAATNPSENYLAAVKLDQSDVNSRTLKGRIKLSTDPQPGTTYDDRNPDNCKMCPKTAMMIFELDPPIQEPDGSGNVTLDADTQLSPDLCSTLGMKSITIPKGVYRQDTLPGRVVAITFNGVKCLPK